MLDGERLLTAVHAEAIQQALKAASVELGDDLG